MRNKLERQVLQGIKFCKKMFCHNPMLSGGNTLNNPMLGEGMRLATQR
jgi:hypothetical protein